MQQLARKISAEIGWGIPSSIILHLLLAFVLLVRLPQLPTTPEQSVKVELVPPPPPAEETPKQDQSQPVPAEQQAQAQKLAFESASSDPKDDTPEQSDVPPAAVETKEEQQPEEAQPDAQSATAQDAYLAAAPAVENPPVPQPKPNQQKPAAKAASEEPGKNFKQARRLYSKDALSDPRVKQALGKLSPTDRVIQICSIEALEQIRHQQPGAFPDMLARAGGSVSSTGLTVSNGAFRSRAQWYGVDFKCQVNAEAMSIQSFSYAIGHAIPESEWGERQLPRD
ncbi:DUF930 domain-containing protein [Ochrobactrum sp. Q0168]|uniref:DUF930 domain-containing protein n=1 Tax=Ochrobactrum sp. Q0168 TaxID=2793241 RepID=UPI0018EBF6F5|nr:DUF930 domain-containing protein [Ochrobactrum sp. Q0168]